MKYLQVATTTMNQEQKYEQQIKRRSRNNIAIIVSEQVMHKISVGTYIIWILCQGEVFCATHIINRATTQDIRRMTPFEKWYQSNLLLQSLLQ